ncbi:MAG: MnhB domain-containing protein [Terricaulis sp.]
MRPAPHLVLGSALRFYAPLLALLTFSILSTHPANSGVGFIAGVAFGLVLILHVLVFGADAFRAAFPATLARLFAAAGAVLAFVAAALPRMPGAAQAMEGALCIATIGAVALMLTVLAGRAPTLRDEEW